MKSCFFLLLLFFLLIHPSDAMAEKVAIDLSEPGFVEDVRTPSLMMRTILNPTRATLDLAAWTGNPLLSTKMERPFEGQSASPAFTQGFLPDVFVQESLADSPPEDLSAGYLSFVWEPFVEWVARQNEEGSAPLIDAAYFVSREKWGVRRVTQRIARLYWSRSKPGDAWVRVDVDPRLDAGGITDADNDGAPEFFAQLKGQPMSALLELMQIYVGRKLNERDLSLYFNELAAAWYDKHYVFARDPQAFSPFPNASLQLGAEMLSAIGETEWQHVDGVIERPALTDDGSPTAGRFLAVFRVKQKKAPQASHASRLSTAWQRVGNQEAAPLTGFRKAMAEAFNKYPEDRVVPGRVEGTLFFRKGLDFLATDDLATQPSPPGPVLADFARQLKGLGIEFIFVPIPVKASVYPDWFADVPQDLAPNVAGLNFYTELRDAEVNVLDPAPVLREARKAQPETDLYLRTDTHWTPAGMRVVAEWLASELRNAGFEAGEESFGSEAREISFKGNLVRMLDEDVQRDFPLEKHTAHQVLDAGGNPLGDTSADSPLLVLGDSYLTIYQREQCGSAGLAAHLAQLLGVEIDLIANQGGGPQTRIDLARRMAASPGYLKPRRFLVLAMSERDLFQPFGGWKSITLPR